jgi:hypothetical protein
MEQNWPVARKNSVRHHGREPRETKQECAKTCCECDSDHWQQWQLYGCHIGLMRRAFTDPKKAMTHLLRLTNGKALSLN